MEYLAVLRRKGHVAASLAAETAKLLHDEGVSAAVRFALDTARGILRERFGPSRSQRTNIVDQRYGTDRAQNVKLHELDISSPNYQHAVYYRATDLPILRENLNRLSLRHQDYTFIDQRDHWAIYRAKA